MFVGRAVFVGKAGLLKKTGKIQKLMLTVTECHLHETTSSAITNQ